MNTLAMGVLLGLSIAVTSGPNAMICMSRTLAAGRTVGFRCGLGAASARAIYASLAVVGADRASGVLDRSTFALHIVGGLLLIVLGLRLWRAGPVPPSGSTTRPYVTTLALGLENPLTIVTSRRPWRPEPSPPAPGPSWSSACSPAPPLGGASRPR